MRYETVFTLVVLAIMLSGCGRPGDGREGGSDKREWSILQNLFSKYRDEIIDHPEVRQVEEYMIICVAHHEDGRRVWVMADPKSPPFYKQMPSGNYWLTKEQIEDIRKQANPITTVLEALESHIK